MPLQIRRGTEAERQAMTEPLAEGELLFVTNNQQLFIGARTADGTPILGGVGIAGYNDEAAQDATAALFANGTHGNINFVYDSNTSISATVDLSEYVGVIGADGVRAQILGADNFVFFDGSSNRVVLENIINSDVSPAEQNVYNLGSSTNRFQDLYLNDSVWIGAAQITADGSTINLPAGSTIGGSIIGSGSGDGIIEGSNYKINIIGDDSTVIVNSSTRSINAPGGIVGDLTGSVFADNSSTIINGITGDINTPVLSASQLISIGDSSPLTISKVGNLAILNTEGSNAIQALTDIFYVGDVNRNSQLRVYSLDSPGANSILVQNYNDTSSLSNNSNYLRSRGTGQAPLSVLENDQIHNFTFGGYDGTSFENIAAQISSSVDGSVSTGIIPGRLTFSTADFTGVLRPALLINNEQLVQFDTGIAGDNITTRFNNFTNTANSLTTVNFTRLRGTREAPQTPVAGDRIYSLSFNSSDGTDVLTAAQIQGEIAEVTGSGVPRGRFRFMIASTTGNLQVAMTITPTSTNMNTPVRFPGYADATARDTAVPNPLSGMVVFVVDVAKLQVNTDGTTGGWVNLH